MGLLSRIWRGFSPGVRNFFRGAGRVVKTALPIINPGIGAALTALGGGPTARTQEQSQAGMPVRPKQSALERFATDYVLERARRNADAAIKPAEDASRRAGHSSRSKKRRTSSSAPATTDLIGEVEQSKKRGRGGKKGDPLRGET